MKETAPVAQLLPLKMLVESPRNCRRTYDAQRLTQKLLAQDETGLARFLIELTMIGDVRVYSGAQATPIFDACVKGYAVDRAAVEAEVAAGQKKPAKTKANGQAPRACRVCGCTETTPYLDGFDQPCHWVAKDLCSQCQQEGAQVRAAASRVPVQAKTTRKTLLGAPLHPKHRKDSHGIQPGTSGN